MEWVLPMNSPPFDLESKLQQHGDALRWLAVDLLGDRAAVDDALQETWLSALQRPPRRDGEAGGWLAAVLRNAVRQLRRSERRRVQREAAAARSEAVEDPAAVLAREEQVHRLVAAVSALPAAFRAAVWQRYFEGKPPRQIARADGVPLATVKGRLQRGLQQLRERLQAEGEDWRGGLALAFGCPAGAAVSTTATGTGVLLMATWTKVLAAAVVVAALGVLWWMQAPPAAVPALPPPIVDAGSSEAAMPVADRPQQRSEVPSPGSGLGNLLVAVRWRRDAAPAAEVEVLAAAGDGVVVDGQVPGGWHSIGRTDREGRLFVAGLEPGWLALRPRDVDRPQWRAIVSGSEARAEFELDACTIVRGIVVDRAGAPVTGADVWLSEPLRTSVGEVVAQSDAGGRFELGFVGDARCIAACAAAVGASSPVPVLPCAPVPVAVRIVLEWPVWHVHGEVVDAQGSPIEGATVVAGSRHEQGEALFGGMAFRGMTQAHMQLQVPPVVTRSDAAGRFAASTCSRNPEIVAWAPGHGARQLLSADAGATVRVVLASEAVVSGRVCDAAGNGLGGVAMSAHATNWRIGFEAASPWLDWSTRTDASGAYCISGLPAGEFRLEARHVVHGHILQESSLAAGQHLDWSPRYAGGLPLAVRVRDGGGLPVVGCIVHIDGKGLTAEKAPYKDIRNGRTDVQGMLRFEHCWADTYSVRANPDDAFVPWPRVGSDRVRPGEQVCEIVLFDWQPASACMFGSVTDSAGDPLSVGAEVSLRIASSQAPGRGGFFHLAAEPFRIGPLYPGFYRLRLRAPGFAPLEVDELCVDGSGDLDLGKLVLLRCGSLSVTAFDARGTPCDVDAVSLVRSGRNAGKRAAGSGIAFTDLAAGDYDLMLWSKQHGIARQQVHIAAGANTDLALQCLGVSFRIEVRAPKGWSGGCELRWIDEHGEVLGTEVSEEPPAPASPVRFDLHRSLPVGGYRLELRGRESAVLGAVDLRVATAIPAPIVLEVREVDWKEWQRWGR